MKTFPRKGTAQVESCGLLFLNTSVKSTTLNYKTEQQPASKVHAKIFQKQFSYRQDGGVSFIIWVRSGGGWEQSPPVRKCYITLVDSRAFEMKNNSGAGTLPAGCCCFLVHFMLWHRPTRQPFHFPGTLPYFTILSRCSPV